MTESIDVNAENFDYNNYYNNYLFHLLNRIETLEKKVNEMETSSIVDNNSTLTLMNTVSTQTELEIKSENDKPEILETGSKNDEPKNLKTVSTWADDDSDDEVENKKKSYSMVAATGICKTEKKQNIKQIIEKAPPNYDSKHNLVRADGYQFDPSKIIENLVKPEKQERMMKLMFESRVCGWNSCGICKWGNNCRNRHARLCSTTKELIRYVSKIIEYEEISEIAITVNINQLSFLFEQEQIVKNNKLTAIMCAIYGLNGHIRDQIVEFVERIQSEIPIQAAAADQS